MADTPNNISLLLGAMVSGYQSIENMLQDLLNDRSIDTAAGVQLDMIGAVVGQLRQGLDDTTYRRYIRARIAANRSNGVSEDLIRVALLVLADASPYVQLDPQVIATEVVRILNDPLSDTVANALLLFLQDAVAAGVRIILESQYVVDSDQLFFARSSFATGNLLMGDISIAVNSTNKFPPTGTLRIDTGLAGDEVVSYTGLTANSFTGVTPLAHNHTTGCQVAWDDGQGKTLGTATNTALGGMFASARDAAHT